jgi:DNA-binding transcriptional ArsR family regulator
MTLTYGTRYAQVPAMFEALRSKTARAVLHQLALGVTSQSEMARMIGVSQPTVCRHVARLARAGLVQRSSGLCGVDSAGIEVLQRFLAENFRGCSVARR